MTKKETKLQKVKDWFENRWLFVIIILIITTYMLLSNVRKAIKEDFGIKSPSLKNPDSMVVQNYNSNGGPIIINNQRENGSIVNNLLQERDTMKTISQMVPYTFDIKFLPFPDLVKKIENITKYTYKKSSIKNKIDFGFTGTIEKLQLSMNQYRYTGGSIIIRVDNMDCQIIYDSIGILDLHGDSGSKVAIENKINSEIYNKIQNNINHFAKKISQCILKK